MSSKIYTKTGDEGKTSLFGGDKVWKDDSRVEAYGTLDELNSWIGYLATFNTLPDADIQKLFSIQKSIMTLSAYLADPKSIFDISPLSAEIRSMEDWIDLMQKDLPQLTKFILPGGTSAAAVCHIARTVCRRSERLVVKVHQQYKLDTQATTFINRLSDLLFVLARYINYLSGTKDVLW